MIAEAAVKLDLSDVSEELSFLLYLLREEPLDESTLQPYISDMDWNKFMTLVLYHRVYPLIYLKLRGVNPTLIPAPILQSLQLHYHNNTMKMLHLSREMSHICEALDKSEIRTLLLKGPILATELYGDLGHRTSKDLDLLVTEEEVEHAENILLQRGYELEDKRELDNWKKKSHHLSYKHTVHGTQVELHWRLNPHYSESYSFDRLWERRNQVRLSNQLHHYLGNEDLLCYLADHGARHAWFRLRWLQDIALLLPKINIVKLRRHYEQYGEQQFTGQAILLLLQLLSTKIPPELVELTTSAKAQRLAEGALFYIKRIVRLNPVPEKSVAWHYNRYLFSLMTTKQKLAYISNKLQPSSVDVLTLPLPKSLYFLYFPLRPFLWLRRQFKRESVLKDEVC